MKAILLLLTISSMLFLQCKNDTGANSEKGYSDISFSDKRINIGQIKLGSSKEIFFYVRNNSQIPLIIDSVKSSCSCTVSKFPHQPILKNDSGLIVAIYTPNPTNIGAIDKSLVVLSNTKPAFNVLSFYGTVITTSHLKNRY